MEIGWLEIVIILIAWACSGVSTGFGFYLISKKEDFSMNSEEKGYLLAAATTAAVALGLTTLAVLIITFMGSKRSRTKDDLIKDMLNQKLELENRIEMMKTVQPPPSVPMSVELENPIPIRSGRGGRPLIT